MFMPSQATAKLQPDDSIILERSRGLFLAQWKELIRLRKAVIKNAKPDDIHDLRVASRRFRALHELFALIIGNDSKQELKKKLRNLTRALGGVRNIDEALLFFESRMEDTTDLQAILHHQRTRELKRIIETLGNFDFDCIDRMVRKMIAGLNDDCLKELKKFSFLSYFSDVSLRQYLPIHNLLEVSKLPENHSSRHELRIAIKKWRYSLEIIAQVLDRNYNSVLEMLKEYQSILGRMNDITEFRTLIADLGLPVEDLEKLKAILKAEDTLLLEHFRALMERKPLVYSFLI